MTGHLGHLTGFLVYMLAMLGVIFIALLVLRDKKTVANDGQVGVVAGLLDCALPVKVLNGRRGDSRADLHGRRTVARLAQRLAERIGKFRAGGFETDGGDVGNIIANDVHPLLELSEAGDT